MPSHNHTQQGSDEPTGNAGLSEAINIMQPWLALNYVVGVEGTYPSRALDLNSVDELPQDPSTPSHVLNGGTPISDRKARQLLETLLKATVSIWKEIGATPDQLQYLQTLTVDFVDLPGGILADVNSEDTIRLDRDAGGRGWFMDSTPHKADEYKDRDRYSNAKAAEHGEASQHYDLLTTLLHEQAHLLGQNHLNQPGDLMHGSLSIGIRKYPQKWHLVPDYYHSPEPHSGQNSLIGNDSLIGAIELIGNNWAPKNSATASGQVTSIKEYESLFSLLGTNYGGDGERSFALPDFQGRAVIGSQGGAQGPGLSNYYLGTTGGRETADLIEDQLPVHNHSEPSLGDTIGLNHQLLSSEKNLNLEQPSSVNETFTINGTLTNKSTLFVSGEIINDGTLTNDSTIANNGTINTINGTFNNNGVISGTGIIKGSIYDKGNVAPGNSAGGLRVDGHLIKSKGKLKIQLGGHRSKKMNREQSNHDFVDINGDAVLGGRLRVELIDDYILRPGKQHKIVKIHGQQFGKFKNYDDGDLVNVKQHNGQKLFISYTGGDGNDVVLYTKDSTNSSTTEIVNID